VIRDISNSDDTINGSQIEDRIEELQAEILPWRAKLCDYAGIDMREDFATHEEACEALAEWLDEHAANRAAGPNEVEAIEGQAIDIRALADGVPYDGGVAETDLVATIEAIDVDEDVAEELRILKALAQEIEDYAGDSVRDSHIIRDSYFAEYVEELVKDIGDMPEQIPDYIAIDWEKTADNVRVDYTEIDYDGVTYLVR
jgi:hypothetical protein